MTVSTPMRISTLGAFQDVRRRTALARVAPAARPTADSYVPAARPAAPPLRPAAPPLRPATPAARPVTAPVHAAAPPAPIRPASLPRPAGALDGFGLKVGSTYAIAPGTTVKGQAVTGTARVVAVGPDHVELRMKGAAAGGLVNFDVRFKAAKQPSGAIKLTAHMDGGQVLLDQQARILKQAAGDLQMRTADGKQARLAVASRGLNIQVNDMNLQLVRTA